MNGLDVQALLAPISEERPCGDDLEYDAAFMALEDAARGKPEQQFGDTVIPAQDPDWRAMRQGALDLMNRTRDLRLAVHLLRADTRMNGFTGFAQGLQLIRGLLDQHWDHVYPMLDVDDDHDPTMRLNALAPLSDGETVLADLRQARIGREPRGVTVRQLELAAGRAEPTEGELVLGEAAVREALAALMAEDADLAEALRSVHETVRGIEAVIGERAGGTAGPDLSPLRQMVRMIDDLVQRASDGGEASATSVGEAPGGAAEPGAPAAGGPGVLRTREDVQRALDRVCEWIERHEPTNPAPLLIRRAQRLMGKNFLDIIRDLAPDGLSEVERIAGVDRE